MKYNNKMMATKKKEIRTLHAKGKGTPIAKLAKKYKLSESGVRWHLKN